MKKTIVIVVALIAVVAAAAYQRGMPPSLVKHTTTLKDAAVLQAKLNVREVGGKTETFTITYAKPNMIKIESPTEVVVSNGKTLTVYNKLKNSYTETAMNKADLITRLSAPAVWGWVSFIQNDPAKIFKTSVAAGDRKLRGVDVSQATVTLIEKDATATLYIDSKLGVARGFMLKKGTKQWVVWAETISTSKSAMDAAAFEFAAPEGATLVEAAAEGEASFKDVQAVLSRSCMPCHGRNAQAGLDVRTYRSIMSSRTVVANNSSRSKLIHALRGTNGAQKMPQGRAPLSEDNIKMIEAWIDAGAKE